MDRDPAEWTSGPSGWGGTAFGSDGEIPLGPKEGRGTFSGGSMGSSEQGVTAFDSGRGMSHLGMGDKDLLDGANRLPDPGVGGSAEEGVEKVREGEEGEINGLAITSDRTGKACSDVLPLKDTGETSFHFCFLKNGLDSTPWNGKTGAGCDGTILLHG